MYNEAYSTERIRKLVTIGTLGGISIFLGITRLGFIPLVVFNLTIMHVPAIIGALLEGPIVGASIGLIFGLFSMYQNFVAPTSLTFFIFLNPIIALTPRILIGIVTYYVYKLLKNKFKNNSISIGIAAIAGTLTNSIGVLGLTYLIYLEKYAEALNISKDLVGTTLLGILFTNSLAEATFSALIAIPLISIMSKIRRN
jgi:uncharacterized membrane protein